jgi:hypothetical protein
VGDKQHIQAGLDDLQRGPVKMRDADGNIL